VSVFHSFVIHGKQGHNQYEAKQLKALASVIFCFVLEEKRRVNSGKNLEEN